MPNDGCLRRQELLESAIADLDSIVSKAMLVNGSEAGCTAVVCVVNGDRLYVANVGDSRVVLSRGGKPIIVTRDHRPSDPDEAARITACGARIIDGYVEGLIGVTRALGDIEVVSGVKIVGLSAVPDVFEVNVKEVCLSPDDFPPKLTLGSFPCAG